MKLQDENVNNQALDLPASVQREIVGFGMKLSWAYPNEITF